MRDRVGLSGVVAMAAVLLSGSATGQEPAAAAPAARRFHVRYVATLEDLPDGGRLRLWVPVPADDEAQRVTGLRVDSPWPWREEREARFGNRMLHVDARVGAGGATFAVEYDVERREERRDLAALATDGEESTAALAEHLRAPRLGAPTERVRAEAARLAEGRPGALAAARAFFDHVREQMDYDKTVEGWGRGDVARACDVRRGNCTDYHAYFMALCHAAGVGARFQIGLFGPYEPRPGRAIDLGVSYHCWAEARVPGRAWVPVDISEADKDPARAEQCFGGLSANRVTLSRGRDLVLAPPQAGEPLNFFVEPYAEVDGRPFAASRQATWTDAP